MSDTRTDSKPHPWLTFLLPLLLACVPAAVAWGAMSSDSRHASARQTETELRLKEMEARQRAADITLAELSRDVKATREGVAAIQQALLNAGAATLVPRMAQPPPTAYSQNTP